MTETTPDSSRAQRAISASAARMIETTRRAWQPKQRSPPAVSPRSPGNPSFHVVR